MTVLSMWLRIHKLSIKQLVYINMWHKVSLTKLWTYLYVYTLSAIFFLNSLAFLSSTCSTASMRSFQVVGRLTCFNHHDNISRRQSITTPFLSLSILSRSSPSMSRKTPIDFQCDSRGLSSLNMCFNFGFSVINWFNWHDLIQVTSWM